MKTYIHYCLILLACISLCHGADYTNLDDIGGVNRALVKLTQFSTRMEPYILNDRSATIAAMQYPPSKLKITTACHGEDFNVWVLDTAHENKAIWDNSFISGHLFTAKAEWYDAMGEQIAVRHHQAYKLIYRVSYMSLLKKLNTDQLVLLRHALQSIDQYGTPFVIHYNDDVAHYRSLPSELKLAALFNPTIAVRLSEAASAIFSCFRACHNVRWLIA
jgi:hypothetical protein